MSASATAAAQSVPNIEDYDFVGLGSGEGTKFVAWTLARQGKRTAIVERRWIGGSCPNIACLPSKNIIHSAQIASYARRSVEFGIRQQPVEIDMAAVRARKRAMVDGLVKMHLDNFQSSGAELVLGSGRFIAPRTIEVSLSDGGTRILRGHDVAIGTGTRAHLPAIDGLDAAKPLTHIEALELDHIPGHLLVLGGGFVGLELAQAFRRFGRRVTVIERNRTIAHQEDDDVTTALEQLFQDEGIDIVTDANVLSVEGLSGSSVCIRIEQDESAKVIEGTHILVATGRTPNTEGIGLDVAGVELTPSGYVKVNERLETTSPHTWAIGDCAGSPQFTHIGFDDFRIVRDNILGGNRVTTGRYVPSCTFTDPELAHIGLSEKEAKRRGIAYRLAKIPMVAVLRTRTLSETRGFLKALVEVEGDRILGFTGFGVGAGEIMAAVQVAMIGNLPYTTLRDAVLTHPTLCEGLVALFSNVLSIRENG